MPPLKRSEWPERGELVLAAVQKVTDYGAYVTLEEYGNKEGLLHRNEISTSWVRNIRDHVREGQKLVLKVLRVDSEKKHIDLSRKRVNKRERIDKVYMFKRERKAETFLRVTAEKLQKPIEEIFEKAASPMEEAYGDVYTALEESSRHGAEVLTNTIRGNKAATSNYSSYGGGLLLYNSSAVTVAGNRIEDNWTNPSGGTGFGAGVLVWYSDAHLARNTIISNSMGITAIPFGKGVYIESTTPVTLSNNLIARNAADVYGGAVYVGRYISPASQALLVNNTIADNGGSGVVAQWYAVVTMTNNLIVTHTVGLTNTHPASSTISADTNLFWNTSDPITGTNAILQDPLLTADYHLGSGSPAIDAGLTIPWLTVDLEGNPRPQGSGYDIGAFEEVEGKVYLPLILKGY